MKKGSVNGNSYEIYKIKLSIRSKGRGKSGGARIVSCFSEERKEVYLLTIYDKSEMDNITDSDLKNIIQTLPFNNLQ